VEDAFVHLPWLRERIVPADRSALRVTDAVLADWDHTARLQGRCATWRTPDAERDAQRLRLLHSAGAPAPGEDVWVFAYGSLMWDPGFWFSEVRRADLTGYRRAFSFRTVMARGTPEHPALMLSLESQPGRVCQGLVFRVDGAVAPAELELLWRREMIRGAYCPSWLPVSTPQGWVTALVFGPNPAYAEYVGVLPLASAAAIIARGCGPLGTNRDYLEQLVSQLEGLGIPDPDMRALRQVVDAACPIAVAPA
jgi:glutathione-specific gamma-glutamylcyclotransferase